MGRKDLQQLRRDHSFLPLPRKMTTQTKVLKEGELIYSHLEFLVSSKGLKPLIGPAIEALG